MIDPTFWRGRRVALTGHTGFKGAWLSLWLTELGADVRGYALAGTPDGPFATLRPAVASTIGDIRDRPTFARWLRAQGADVIFHLAAQPLVRAGYDDPIATFDTNITGTLNLLETARTLPDVRALIVVTSDKAYAPADGRPLREDAALGGDDPYSASKACAEIVTHAYARSFPTRAVIATARAGNVIGGGDRAADRLIPDLIRATRAGTPLTLRYPQAVRPWQHVLEPLAGYLLLAQRAARGDLSVSGAWNFGPAHDDAITVASVVELALADLGLAPLWLAETPRDRELPALRIDAAKARALLEWQAQFRVAEAISETIAWYAAEAAGADMRALSCDQIAAYQRRMRTARAVAP